MIALTTTPHSVRNLFATIEDELAEVDRVLDETLSGYSTELTPLTEYLRHYRGKRLRPALLLLTAKACGRVMPAHHTLAAAVEMIHTATLVHDDLLDGAETRRHIQTVHEGWGNQIAVLLGDMLFSQAFTLTSTVDARACRIIGEATNRVCAGELQQVLGQGNLDLTEAEYFSLIEGKTAALTECCCRLGALFANAGEERVERMASYGRHLGLAFQIADDLLDLTGHESTVGKTLGTDVAQLKLTLPLIHCLTRLPHGESSMVRTALTQRNCHEEVMTAIRQTGSFAHTQYRARECAKTAKGELEDLPWSLEKDVLLRLPDWAIGRDR
jgi:octaprenyl-diphosphate synthase